MTIFYVGALNLHPHFYGPHKGNSKDEFLISVSWILCF